MNYLYCIVVIWFMINKLCSIIKKCKSINVTDFLTIEFNFQIREKYFRHSLIEICMRSYKI